MESIFGAVLSFLISFQLLFVSIYLFTNKKGNRLNNGLLGSIFLLFSISLIDFTIRVSGLVLPIPLLHLIDDGFFFLYGPLLFFYTKRVVYKDFEFNKRLLIHLSPYCIFSILLILQFGFTNELQQEELTDNIINARLPTWLFIATTAIYGHIFIYLWYAWKIIMRYDIEIKNRFSNTDEINLNWLRFIIKAFAFITAIAMIHNLIPVIENLTYYYFSILMLLFASFLFVNRVLVKALNQPEIFSGIEEREKYASSNLKGSEIDLYRSKLVSMMEKEKLFLNPELKSKDLADQLGITPKALSQIINQCFEKNFFDFVNSYRCDEVKRIIMNEESSFTVIEAMYKSGFNSKSSFNKEFKKLTGQTPSEYRKSLLS